MEIGQKVTPIINDGKMININVNIKNKYHLQFRDSYLMLPSSLKELAVAFNVENKAIFPYKFVNDYNIINNYNGKVPHFNYFVNITNEQYINYCDNFKFINWNLRTETLKYCGQDVKSLYYVLEKFFKDNYIQTRVNASKCVSLPSLAFTNFRTKFMKGNDNISIIKAEMFYFIKKLILGSCWCL